MNEYSGAGRSRRQNEFWAGEWDIPQGIKTCDTCTAVFVLGKGGGDADVLTWTWLQRVLHVKNVARLRARFTSKTAMWKSVEDPCLLRT